MMLWWGPGVLICLHQATLSSILIVSPTLQHHDDVSFVEFVLVRTDWHNFSLQNKNVLCFCSYFCLTTLGIDQEGCEFLQLSVFFCFEFQ
jgi:hypothetical protein